MIKRIRKIIRHSVSFSKQNPEKEMKNPLQLTTDLIKWTILNRGYISHFFLLGLDKKHQKLSDFLHYKSLTRSYKNFYPPNYLCILEDKQIFEKFINNFPEFAPKNIGFVTKYHFYLNDAIPKPLESILDYPMKCIVKNIWGYGGKDIFLLTIEAGKIFINGVESTLKDLVNRIPQRCVLQNLLEQHPQIKQLHPSSINTTRIITVNTGSKVEVISSFLRVGTGGKFVDNISRGNIFVPIDKATGLLAKTGYSESPPYFYSSHPETNVVFKNLQIPDFEKALSLCKNLHYQLPYFFILGWDIAYTPTGPVVIESNNIHQVVIEQMVEGGLKKRFDTYRKEFMVNKFKERKLNYA